MNSPLRIALIGAGIMGRQHYQHLRQVPQAQLCAVADPGPQAEAFAAEINAFVDAVEKGEAPEVGFDDGAVFRIPFRQYEETADSQ